MLATNELKFKDGRVWRAKYIPNPDHVLPDQFKLVFEDITLELAYTLREALNLDSQGEFRQRPDVDLFYLED